MSLRPLRCVLENSVFGGIRVIRNGRTTIFIAKMSVLNVWNEPISRWSGRIVNVDAHNVAHVGCYQWHLLLFMPPPVCAGNVLPGCL